MTKLVAVLVSIGLAFGLNAAEPPSAGDFVLQTVGKDSLRGPLEAITGQWSMTVKGTNVPGDRIVSLRRADVALPAFPAGEQIILANGDHLPGEVSKLAGETLRFKALLPEIREVDLPLSAVAVIWRTAPDGTDNPGLLRRQLATGRRRRDTILLRNGDILEGTLTALNGKELRLEVDKKEVPVDFDKVAALAFNTDLIRTLIPKQPYGHLVQENGCRLSLASATTQPHHLKGKTLFGATIEVPLDQVVALDLRQGPAIYLSDLKPRGYEFVSYLGSVRWPYVRDGNVAGMDLSLGGSTYDKGLGLHSASRITYELAGRYRRFEALIGMDDRTGSDASARVQVLVDGKPRDGGKEQEVARRSGPRSIRIDVTDARELTLVVDFGWGDVQGHVDWADARLIK